jgi:hypothetical protein
VQEGGYKLVESITGTLFSCEIYSQKTMQLPVRASTGFLNRSKLELR